MITNKEGVIAKIKEIASNHPPGFEFSPDEVYRMVSIDLFGSRMEFIEYIHSILNEVDGLAVLYRGTRDAAKNYGNCTGLSVGVFA